MNYGLFLKISIIIAIITTLCICALKPKIHKNLVVYNSDYKLVETTVITEEEKELPTLTQTPAKEAKKETQEIKKTQQETKIKIEPKKEVITTVQKPTNTTTVKKTEPKIKTLTEKEEEIQWNIWRSNLQNQIMKDTTLPIIPQGTIFRFSFDVDRYGKITNIQTWSENLSFTPYAIQYIAPTIRNMQGRAILNFPAGSNRYTTHVKGGWKIAPTVRYSTPQDYNDTEKINK